MGEKKPKKRKWYHPVVWKQVSLKHLQNACFGWMKERSNYLQLNNLYFHQCVLLGFVVDLYQGHLRNVTYLELVNHSNDQV